MLCPLLKVIINSTLYWSYQHLYIPSTVDKTDAHEVTEKYLGVLESRHKQLVQMVLQHFLVHLVLVQQKVSVYFHLHRQDR